jgi:hypothetical protein
VSVAKFTVPIEFPADPDPGPTSAVTLDQVAALNEPPVDLTVLFENVLSGGGGP